MMRKSLSDPRVAEIIDLDRLQKITTIGTQCSSGSINSSSSSASVVLVFVAVYGA